MPTVTEQTSLPRSRDALCLPSLVAHTESSTTQNPSDHDYQPGSSLYVWEHVKPAGWLTAEQQQAATRVWTEAKPALSDMDDPVQWRPLEAAKPPEPRRADDGLPLVTVQRHLPESLKAMPMSWFTPQKLRALTDRTEQATPDASEMDAADVPRFEGGLDEQGQKSHRSRSEQPRDAGPVPRPIGSD